MNKLIFMAALALAGASCATPDALTYDDVAGLPRQARLQLMQLASPEEMSAIYHGHLEHVAELPDVTPDERDVLARVGALATPEWYAGQAPGERVAADMAEAEQLVRGLSLGTMRAVANFGDDE